MVSVLLLLISIFAFYLQQLRRRLSASQTGVLDRPVTLTPPPWRAALPGIHVGLAPRNLVSEREGGEALTHLLCYGVAPEGRYATDRHARDAAVKVVGADPHVAHRALASQGRQRLLEHTFGGVPAQLRLEHLADTRERHRLDLADLDWHSGALGRPFTHP